MCWDIEILKWTQVEFCWNKNWISGYKFLDTYFTTFVDYIEYKFLDFFNFGKIIGFVWYLVY
jgi:hypothetical protein